MKLLIMTVGLPRSGKSTWVRGTGLPVVSPDAIRLRLSGVRYDPAYEGDVWSEVREQILTLFQLGDNVILDATSLAAIGRRDWDTMGQRHGFYTAVHVVPTDPATCIERAKATGQEDLIPVIGRMYATLMNPENLRDLHQRRWV